MYESPVELITKNVEHKITQQTDDFIMSEITQQLSVRVDRDELIKAMKYDRQQYDKGFKDASKILRDICSCGRDWKSSSSYDYVFCPYCGGIIERSDKE